MINKLLMPIALLFLCASCVTTKSNTAAPDGFVAVADCETPAIAQGCPQPQYIKSCPIMVASYQFCDLFFKGKLPCVYNMALVGTYPVPPAYTALGLLFLCGPKEAPPPIEYPEDDSTGPVYYQYKEATSR